MEIEDLSYEDAEMELLSSIGALDMPKKTEGWSTIPDLVIVVRERGINVTETQLRDRLEKCVVAGTHERREWGKNVYYRVKPAE